MKVTSKSSNPMANIEAAKTSPLASEKTRDKKGAAADGLGNLGSSDKIDVSNRAQQMKKAKEIASADTIDEAKVAKLQKLIDSGQYKVDAQAVADRLVDEHLLTSS